MGSSLPSFWTDFLNNSPSHQGADWQYVQDRLSLWRDHTAAYWLRTEAMIELCEIGPSLALDQWSQIHGRVARRQATPADVRNLAIIAKYGMFDAPIGDTTLGIVALEDIMTIANQWPESKREPVKA